MRGNTDSNNAASQKQNTPTAVRETLWADLYFLLRPLVNRWVYTSGVSCWLRQADDIAEDIVQEALYRLLKYMKKVEEGKAAPIGNVEHMITVIAHNCCRDWMRRDGRLEHFPTDDILSLEHVVESTVVDPSEIALDTVFQSWLFIRVSNLVKKSIPEKQRIALLRDLAQRMHFGKTPTPLQKAFADKGMALRAYQGWQGKNKRERSQHAANLSISYKKIEEWSKEASLL